MMPTPPEPQTPLAPRLEAALASFGALLSQLGHTRACVCPLCTVLDGAETELEALELLAWAVRARAEEEERAPQHLSEGYWRTVWQEYRRAIE
jgi:hypothetical protein